MKRVLRILFILLLAAFVAACASTPPPATDSGNAVSRAGKPSSDRELFEMGLAALERAGGPDDLAAAREAFASLPQAYPKSRWVRVAEVLVLLIDEQGRLAESVRAGAKTAGEAAAEVGRLQRENEQLRKEMNQLRDRLQADTASLQQENEQLKRDLKLLKELEIQLHQRNRTGR
jgi:regulator of replication initiation timing